MASARRRQVDRLQQELEDMAHPWLFGRGLSTLLPFLYDDDSDADTDTDYADEGAPGLAGLLFYRVPGMEPD